MIMENKTPFALKQLPAFCCPDLQPLAPENVLKRVCSNI
jgi:hypothetical protein